MRGDANKASVVPADHGGSQVHGGHAAPKMAAASERANTLMGSVSVERMPRGIADAASSPFCAASLLQA